MTKTEALHDGVETTIKNGRIFTTRVEKSESFPFLASVKVTNEVPGKKEYFNAHLMNAPSLRHLAECLERVADTLEEPHSGGR